MWRIVFLGLIFGVLAASWFLVGWMWVIFFYLFVGVLIWFVSNFMHWSIILLWAPTIASEGVRDWWQRF